MSILEHPQFVNFDADRLIVNEREFRFASDYTAYNYTAEKTQDLLQYLSKTSPMQRTDTRNILDEQTGIWQSLPGSVKNSKLGGLILGTGTLPMLTCKNCEDCKVKCYGRHGRFLYPTVHDKVVTNTIETIVNPEFYFDMLELQVKSLPFLKALRFDVVGDIISERHLADWITFAKKFPLLPVFGYTKTGMGIETGCKNFNVVNSFLPDGELNFGPLEYVLAMNEKYKNNKEVYLCPKGLPGKDGKKQDKQCSDCLWCAKHKYVILLEH